jgi:hypothetical protein
MRIRLFNARTATNKDIAGHDPHGITPATTPTLAASSEAVNVRPQELAKPTGDEST